MSKFLIEQFTIDKDCIDKPYSKASFILLNQWCEKSLLSSFKIYNTLFSLICYKKWINDYESIPVEDKSNDLTVLLLRFLIYIKNYRLKGLFDKFNSVNPALVIML